MHTRAAGAAFDAEANNKNATAKARSDRNMSRPFPIATYIGTDPARLAPPSSTAASRVAADMMLAGFEESTIMNKAGWCWQDLLS